MEESYEPLKICDVIEPLTTDRPITCVDKILGIIKNQEDAEIIIQCHDRIYDDLTWKNVKVEEIDNIFNDVGKKVDVAKYFLNEGNYLSAREFHSSPDDVLYLLSSEGSPYLRRKLIGELKVGHFVREKESGPLKYRKIRMNSLFCISYRRDF